MSRSSEDKLKEVKFKQFTDQAEPGDAKEIQWQWRQKKKLQKARMNMMIALVVIIVIALIISLMMFGLSSLDPAKDYTLAYNNENYTYIQSRASHLRYLTLKNASTPETKNMNLLGMVFPYLTAWLESNIRANFKILVVPNQNSGISYFTVLIGYYLRKSLGGSLQTIISNSSFKDLTEMNLQQMRKLHGDDRFPVEIIKEYKFGDNFDLILVESNDFYLRLQNYLNSDLIVLKMEGQSNTIKGLFTKSHDTYEIDGGSQNMAGKLGIIWEHYGIYRYQLTKQETKTSLLFTSKTKKSTYPICYQRPTYTYIPPHISQNQSEAIPLIQYLRNKTSFSYNIYYSLTNSLIPIMLSKFMPNNQKIYVNPTQKSLIDSLKTYQSRENVDRFQFSVAFQALPTTSTYLKFNLEFQKDFKGKQVIKIDNLEQWKILKQQTVNRLVQAFSLLDTNGCFFPSRPTTFEATPFYALVVEEDAPLPWLWNQF